MAKKKRTGKRPKKAGKRRPTTTTARPTGAAAKGEGGAFQSGAFQGLPPSASQRKLSPAVQATQGVIEPPPAALSLSTTPLDVLQGVSSLRADGFIAPPPVSITPTIYPDNPQGTIIVQNYITVNVRSEEFRELDNTLKQLVTEVRRSNEISSEVRDQQLSDMAAGREILKAPKPQRGLIELLLVNPLKWLAEKSGSAIIQKLALDALALLSKMLL